MDSQTSELSQKIIKEASNAQEGYQCDIFEESCLDIGRLESQFMISKVVQPKIDKLQNDTQRQVKLIVNELIETCLRRSFEDKSQIKQVIHSDRKQKSPIRKQFISLKSYKSLNKMNQDISEVFSKRKVKNRNKSEHATPTTQLKNRPDMEIFFQAFKRKQLKPKKEFIKEEKQVKQEEEQVIQEIQQEEVIVIEQQVIDTLLQIGDYQNRIEEQCDDDYSDEQFEEEQEDILGQSENRFLENSIEDIKQYANKRKRAKTQQTQMQHNMFEIRQKKQQGSSYGRLAKKIKKMSENLKVADYFQQNTTQIVDQEYELEQKVIDEPNFLFARGMNLKHNLIDVNRTFDIIQEETNTYDNNLTNEQKWSEVVRYIEENPKLLIQMVPSPKKKKCSQEIKGRVSYDQEIQKVISDIKQMKEVQEMKHRISDKRIVTNMITRLNQGNQQRPKTQINGSRNKRFETKIALNTTTSEDIINFKEKINQNSFESLGIKKNISRSFSSAQKHRQIMNISNIETIYGNSIFDKRTNSIVNPLFKNPNTYSQFKFKQHKDQNDNSLIENVNQDNICLTGQQRRFSSQTKLIKGQIEKFKNKKLPSSQRLKDYIFNYSFVEGADHIQNKRTNNQKYMKISNRRLQVNVKEGVSRNTVINQNNRKCSVLQKYKTHNLTCDNIRRTNREDLHPQSSHSKRFNDSQSKDKVIKSVIYYIDWALETVYEDFVENKIQFNKGIDIFRSNEVSYILEMIKGRFDDFQNSELLRPYHTKGLMTIEWLMKDLGVSRLYEKIRNQYQGKLTIECTYKIIIRCQLLFKSRAKLFDIFKNIELREEQSRQLKLLVLKIDQGLINQKQQIFFSQLQKQLAQTTEVLIQQVNEFHKKFKIFPSRFIFKSTVSQFDTGYNKCCDK